LEELIPEFQVIFATRTDDYIRTDSFPSIPATHSDPAAPRRLPLAKQTEVTEMLKGMKERGVIEKSDSPWPSSVVPFRKKNADFRSCVD
jgi:hypothetical protein